MNTAQPKQTTASALPAGGMFYQPKINGIRALWNGAELVTRNGRAITCLDHIKQEIIRSGIGHYHLDGELFTDKVSFQQLNGLIRRKNPTEDHKTIQFHVFDLVEDRTPQHERLRILQQITAGMKTVVPVETVKNGNAAEHYRRFLDQGFEGLIAREPEADYGNGLYKIKPVFDSEYRVIKTSACTVTLETTDGKTFKIENSTHELKPGDRATVEYSMLTDSGIPFQGRLKAGRYDLPEEDFTYHSEPVTKEEDWQTFDSVVDALLFVAKILIVPFVLFVVFCATLLGLLVAS